MTRTTTTMAMWEFTGDASADPAREVLEHMADAGALAPGPLRRLRPPRSAFDAIAEAQDAVSYAGVITGVAVGRLLRLARRVPVLRNGVDGGLAALAEQTARLGRSDDFQVAVLDVSDRESSALFLLDTRRGSPGPTAVAGRST